ncbi:ABC transporter permease [Lysobacter xanthus]
MSSLVLPRHAGRVSRALSTAWLLASREWLGDYRRSRTNAIWPLLHPIAYTALFVALRPVIGLRNGDVAGYALFVFIGFSLWQGWIDVLRTQLNGIRRHRALVVRGELGLGTLMLSTTMLSAIAVLPRLLVAAVAACAMFQPPAAGIAALFVAGGLLLANGSLIGAVLQPFATLSPAVDRVVQAAMLALFVTGGVFTAAPASAAPALRVILAVNPLASLIDAARAPLFGEAPEHVGVAIGWSLCTLVGIVGWPRLGRRLVPIVVERLGN